MVRAYYRRAIREGIVPREADPFFAYTPPRAKRPNRHKLTERELVTLETLDLGGTGSGAPLIARVRDAFLLSLYCAGIRFADVARLTSGDFAEETDEEGRTRLRLSYSMGKTGKRASLRLISQAERIARAYFVDTEGREKSAKAFLFPMLDGYDLSTPKGTWNALGAQNALHNKYLRELGKKAKVAGRLSFHCARHSFADLARRRGWDVYAISKALAHSGLGVTERYLAGFDGELVDRKMGELFGGRG
jgi:integrase